MRVRVCVCVCVRERERETRDEEKCDNRHHTVGHTTHTTGQLFLKEWHPLLLLLLRFIPSISIHCVSVCGVVCVCDLSLYMFSMWWDTCYEM